MSIGVLHPTSEFVTFTDVPSGTVSRVPTVALVNPANGDAINASGAPTVTATSVRTVLTNATGTNWAAFGSFACSALDIVNSSAETSHVAVPIRWRIVGTTDWMPIDTGASYMVTGIVNANQVEIQRNDTSNTQIRVRALALV